LVFVALRQTWGEDRAFFLDDDGVLKSLPTAWTDAAAPDVFVVMAAGRSAFRAEDLLGFAELIARVRHWDGGQTCCKADSAVYVRRIPPSPARTVSRIRAISPLCMGSDLNVLDSGLGLGIIRPTSV
jgi:Family of unknown function (DUF5372)